MKVILVAVLLMCVCGAVTSQSQAKAPQSYDLTKRANNQANSLSNHSCQVLKKNGYFQKVPALMKLCPKKYFCQDTLPLQACLTFKANNDCKNQSPMIRFKYCRLTCNQCGHCTEVPLGLESGAIPDSSITASSAYDSRFAPSKARIRPNKKGYGWGSLNDNTRQWIQVDLGSFKRVTGVAIQAGGDWRNMWVTRYSIEYSDDGKTFKDYQAGKTFTGNSDRITVVKQHLKTPIDARYIRLLPKSWYRGIGLRMELYGCK